MISQDPAPQLEELTQPVQGGNKESSSSFRNVMLEILQTILLALILYFVIDAVLARVRVENISMEPTLQPGEFLLVSKFSYKFGSMQVGDIVVFHAPPSPNQDYIKRIIGLPGDTVRIENGAVFVNQRPLEEDYISAPPDYLGEWEVPQDSIFVLGDNRNSSSDSHEWGFVPVKNIVGKAVVVYWPLKELKVLTHPNIVQASH